MKPNAWIVMRLNKWDTCKVGLYLMVLPKTKSIGFLEVFRTKKDALEALKDTPMGKRNQYSIFPLISKEVK